MDHLPKEPHLKDGEVPESETSIFFSIINTRIYESLLLGFFSSPVFTAFKHL